MKKPAKDRQAQLEMFDIPHPEWGEWQGMPEFVQEDQRSEINIMVHFRDRAGMLAFAELVGQRITEGTPAIWFPEMPKSSVKDLRWKDGEQIGPDEEVLT